MKYIAAKARAVMGRIWSIGERLCREEWKKRMRLFEALVESIMMYGVEIWGWKGGEELERIQDTYGNVQQKRATERARCLFRVKTKDLYR